MIRYQRGNMRGKQYSHSPPYLYKSFANRGFYYVDFRDIENAMFFTFCAFAMIFGNN